jgi:hypothetical protein
MNRQKIIDAIAELKARGVIPDAIVLTTQDHRDIVAETYGIESQAELHMFQGCRVDITSRDRSMIGRMAKYQSMLNARPLSLIEDQRVFYLDTLEEINLCTTCQFFPADCPAAIGEIVFGNGIGNDNVIECGKYTPVVIEEKKQ